jgi:hypothetical protein
MNIFADLSPQRGKKAGNRAKQLLRSSINPTKKIFKEQKLQYVPETTSSVKKIFC